MALDDAVAHRVAGSFHWQLVFYGFKIGEQALDLKTKYILTDTGATMTHFPKDDYIKIMHNLCDGLNCYVDKGWYFVKDCDVTVFKPLWF